MVQVWSAYEDMCSIDVMAYEWVVLHTKDTPTRDNNSKHLNSSANLYAICKLQVRGHLQSAHIGIVSSVSTDYRFKFVHKVSQYSLKGWYIIGYKHMACTGASWRS